MYTFARMKQRHAMLRFRRAHEAHRDASLVFQAAAQGRPLELQRRLVLGKLAGGASFARLTRDGSRVTPIQVASLKGFHECAEVLRRCCSVEYDNIPVEFNIEDSRRKADTILPVGRRGSGSS